MNNSKVILLDMDGVVVKSGEVFSARISKKLNISLEKVLPFFKNEFQLCLIGKADLKKVLAKYASKWGWKGTIGELLTFWFDGEKEVDEEMIKQVSNYRNLGYKIYIVTNNEKYRVEFLWNKILLKNTLMEYFPLHNLDS